MKSISVEEVQQLLESGKELNLIDVREVDEVAAGIIPTAINIPLGLIEFRMNELDKTKEYIMVCRSGGRSGNATMFLENQGFNVVNMDGGMLAWTGDVE
ncbi:rhodanese-like domain-containing protein [Viridibacillus sp. FSL R5-0477]|uniref:Rhodanese-like protein n=1 Tax=Viridibacillus arenosi FSL R5-213 TaxID=1227360 RepID=W4ERI9_9BACL|nr:MULTISPECIES: rhodanese-like domain-containing protein [Viridibacillus]ETT82627.1 Rhodanese-like protein [Viridibacillus arenosi FSL R5-213]OMC85588.1 rhodanese [Viridibacillus sp. FSL H8-0123]OMC87138.1 rhodanese [Viridibacillus sp. FSL H7-0596]OMC92297.1 rhodanese [Viridibacillus arenosi]